MEWDYYVRINNVHAKKEHNKCFKIALESLISNIESKKEKCLLIHLKHEIIGLLSNYRDEAINKIRQDVELFGLNENEKQLMKEIKNGKCEKTTGKTIWEIIHSERQKQSIMEMVDQTYNQLQNYFKKAKYSLQSTIQNLTNCLNSLICQINNFELEKQNNQSLEQKPQKKDFKSRKKFQFYNQHEQQFNHSISFNYQTNKNKFPSCRFTVIYAQIKLSSLDIIINDINQFQTITAFFLPKSIKSSKLLYRASQNNFQGKKFHQKCDGVSDTLTLAETEFGKIIGGYTPIKWSQSANYVKDDSMTSFVFFLTNGDKFKLKSRNDAVYHHPFHGPIFGGGHDLCIENKTNQNNYSRARINDSYFNEKYQHDEKLWSRFNGGNSHNFKVKKWQVWSLQFC